LASPKTARAAHRADDGDPQTQSWNAASSSSKNTKQSRDQARAARGCLVGALAHRQKQNQRVEKHRALGVHAERYPLSGASRFRGSGHDIDLYLFGRENAPAVCEVKARKNGSGFATLEKWLGEFDALFLRRNNADALVVLPWRTWAALIRRRP
jgi:hypothetical protein